MLDFPRVSCRIRIVGNPEVARTYGSRFGQLMERVATAKFTPGHYRRLHELRRLVVGRRIEDCAELVEGLDATAMRLLISSAPMFNLASTNTKAYILVALSPR